MTAEPVPVDRDSRGILDPWLLRQRVSLTRYPPSAGLTGLVERFWAVRWDLPPGLAHAQQVLTHPGANFAVGHGDAQPGDDAPGPVEARLYGVARTLTTRLLVGQGWAVAAMTRPGGLGAFVSVSASDLTDRAIPLGEAIGIDEVAALKRIDETPDEAGRVAVLGSILERAVDPAQAAPARRVAEVAQFAESDRTVRRLADLCAWAGIGQRTLQRMFLQYAGVSPTWVLRRYRLLDAAEALRNRGRVPWANLAADLGYADQAHLIRDFRAATGHTPAAYAQLQRPQ